MPNARVSAAEFEGLLYANWPGRKQCRGCDAIAYDGAEVEHRTYCDIPKILAAFQAEREHSEKVAKYARHHDDCAIELYVFEGIEEPPPCDCGLNDLLKGEAKS